MLCLLQWSKDKETGASQYEQGGDSKIEISYNIVCYVCYSGVRMKTEASQYEQGEDGKIEMSYNIVCYVCYSGVRMKRQRLVSMNKEKMVKKIYHII